MHWRLRLAIVEIKLFQGNKRRMGTVFLLVEALLIQRSPWSTRFKENVNADHVSPGSTGIRSHDSRQTKKPSGTFAIL
jgi:hypothetical protein